MSDKKYFVLMENGKDTSQVFASKQPRGAASTRNRGHTNIRLRERGTKRVHVFTGSITMVDKPAGGLLGSQTRSRRLTSRSSASSTFEARDHFLIFDSLVECCHKSVLPPHQGFRSLMGPFFILISEQGKVNCEFHLCVVD